MLTIIAAAIAAGVIGALGPLAISRLPEPAEPADDKKLYADLADTPRLGRWLGLVAALAAGIVASQVDIMSLIPVWVVMAGVGSWLAFIDWHTKLLPFVIVYPFNFVILMLVVLAAAVEGDWAILTRGLIAAAVVFALFYLSNLFYAKGLGYGDVRMSFGLGLALGAVSGSAAFFGIWLGFALGAFFSILLARFKLVDPQAFAFGPYLILGALLGAIWSPGIF